MNSTLEEAAREGLNAATPKVGSEDFVEQASDHQWNPILLIHTHPHNWHVAHVWNTTLINAAQAVHDDHRHMASFCFNNLSTAPLAGRVGVRVQRHEDAGSDMMQQNLPGGQSGRDIANVEETRQSTVIVQPLADALRNGYAVIVMLRVTEEIPEFSPGNLSESSPLLAVLGADAEAFG